LRADAHAIAKLQSGDGASDAHDVPDDLVAYADGIVCCAPARAQRVDVGAADAAVRDFDVDVDWIERFGCEGCPGHVALGGGLVVAEPAGKFGGRCHCCAAFRVYSMGDQLMLRERGELFALEI
jgi:hypothetical protein